MTFPFVQHITTKQQHKYLIVITVSVKALVWIFKGLPCRILFAKLGLWEKLYLFTQSSSFPVPVMWPIRDKTTEERGNANGNILFTVHEKRKREKCEYDKKKKQEICSQWKHCAAFHTAFNMHCVVVLGRGALIFTHVPLMLLTSALCLLVKEALHF